MNLSVSQPGPLQKIGHAAFDEFKALTAAIATQSQALRMDSSGIGFKAGPWELDAGVICTAPPLTASVNDYAPSGFPECIALLLTATTAVSITGFAQRSTARRLFLVWNTGTSTITLEHAHASSSPEARITGPNSADVTLYTGEAIWLTYDPVTERNIALGERVALKGRTITGTTNQVNVANGDGVSGNPTLSTPQDIHTGASPTFAALTLSAALTVANGGTGIALSPRVAVTDSNATQSINDSTWTTVTFDTETYDTDTMHSTSSNTGRLTATTAGLYLVDGVVSWDTNTTNKRQMRILANGSTIIPGGIDTRAAVASMYQSARGHALLTAGQYVELQVWQDSGGARTIARDGGITPYFTMTRVLA